MKETEVYCKQNPEIKTEGELIVHMKAYIQGHTDSTKEWVEELERIENGIPNVLPREEDQVIVLDLLTRAMKNITTAMLDINKRITNISKDLKH